MFAAGACEFEQVLEQCDELILAFAVCQEQREEDREVTRPDEDLLCYLFCEVFG